MPKQFLDEICDVCRVNNATIGIPKNDNTGAYTYYCSACRKRERSRTALQRFDDALLKKLGLGRK